MPDSLATIISVILTEEDCPGIRLPNGEVLAPKDLEKYFRTSLSSNGEWVKMESMESFLSSLGFQVSRVTGPGTCSKIAVLTRQQGHFLVVCKLQKARQEFHHAVAYLAGKRWLVDNLPGQKVMEVEDSDIEALTSVNENHEAHRKVANELFKKRFDGAINEILVWYEITRKPNTPQQREW